MIAQMTDSKIMTGFNSFDSLALNFDGADVQPLSGTEMQDVDGGIIPILIGMAIGVTVAHYISTH